MLINIVIPRSASGGFRGGGSYKSRFISNLSICSTTFLSKHITSALTAVKDHILTTVKQFYQIVTSIPFDPSKTQGNRNIGMLKLCYLKGSQVSSFKYST